MSVPTNPDPLTNPDLDADSEIVSARVFDAPRERVFQAFDDPTLLAQWWGPKGFTNEFQQFDFRPGGAWRFLMHGPDGTVYQMANDFLEIVPLEKISFYHPQSGHEFRLTMTFAEEAGKTRLTWQMRFDAREEAQRVRQAVSEANEQNFDRLEALLATMA
jgi:uncharacterized protein YndB with AHSA1/START domain